MTFNEWWNADNLTNNNPYEPDSAAYWAWEGWQASIKPVVGSDDDTDKAAELGWHLQAQIKAAVLAEREECAKMFEGEEHGVISAAIRARTLDDLTKEAQLRGEYD